MASDHNPEFDAFVRDAEPQLRRALLGCRPVESVSDGVAEALAFAWQHWDRVQEMANPVGYLFRVAQTATRGRRPARLAWPSPSELGMRTFEPALVPAMLALPRRQRTAIWLVHGCGWTHAETAEAMGLSASTVSTHVARGMRTLRKKIGAKTDE